MWSSRVQRADACAQTSGAIVLADGACAVVLAWTLITSAAPCQTELTPLVVRFVCYSRAVLAPQGRFKLKQKDAVVNNKQASWQVQSNPPALLCVLANRKAIPDTGVLERFAQASNVRACLLLSSSNGAGPSERKAGNHHLFVFCRH